MKTVPQTYFKAHISALIEQSWTEGPIVITRYGKAMAVLVAIAEEDDIERIILARSPKFQAVLQKSERSIQNSQGLSEDEFWRMVEQNKP
jgi:prevent-host-death family protein